MGIPTNIADFVAEIKDGTLGEQKIMIGDVIVDALTNINVMDRKEVTRRPVQSGFSVDIGVVDVPIEIDLNIVLTNPSYSPESFITAGVTGEFSQLTETYNDKVDRLYEIMNTKEIIDLITHEKSYFSFVISEINRNQNAEELANCWIGNVHLMSFSNYENDLSVDIENAKTAAKEYVGSM
jgi:hypothetical protein